MFKEQKGITLVALVITIIVLLILAGVSIALVVGQNGILTRATNAVATNAKATAEQEVKLGAADALTAYYEDWAFNQGSTHKGKYLKDAAFYNANKSPNATITATANGVNENSDSGTVVVEYTIGDTTYTFNVDVETGEVTPATTPTTP